MNLTDLIADAIMKILEEQGGIAEIRRNDFANKIGCVPSQINYVLTSRFTPEQGFVVESRRGGGGCIKIMQISDSKRNQAMHIIHSLGEEIDFMTIRSILINLCYQNFLDQKIAAIILSAVSENALKDVPADQRDRVRASILKNMLLVAA